MRTAVRGTPGSHPTQAPSSTYLRVELRDVGVAKGSFPDLIASKVVKLTNALIYDGPTKPLIEGDIWFQNGRIIDPAARFWQAASSHAAHACDIEIDCGGAIVSPGFIDVQFNGAYGVDFSDTSLSQKDLDLVFEKLPSTGVTSLCPTLVSSDASTYRTVVGQFAEFARRQERAHKRRQGGAVNTFNGLEPSEDVPRVMARNLGLHLEGPFINPKKKGAHAQKNIEAAAAALQAAVGAVKKDDNAGLACPSPAECDAALQAFETIYGLRLSSSTDVSSVSPKDGDSAITVPRGFVRIVTLAPEMPHGQALTRALTLHTEGDERSNSSSSSGQGKGKGVIVSVGHTDADIRSADESITNGACLITHLFNAMTGFHHRDPGVPGLLGRRYGGVKARKAAAAAGGSSAAAIASTFSPFKVSRNDTFGAAHHAHAPDGTPADVSEERAANTTNNKQRRSSADLGQGRKTLVKPTAVSAAHLAPPVTAVATDATDTQAYVSSASAEDNDGDGADTLGGASDGASASSFAAAAASSSAHEDDNNNNNASSGASSYHQHHHLHVRLEEEASRASHHHRHHSHFAPTPGVGLALPTGDHASSGDSSVGSDTPSTETTTPTVGDVASGKPPTVPHLSGGSSTGSSTRGGGMFSLSAVGGGSSSASHPHSSHQQHHRLRFSVSAPRLPEGTTARTLSLLPGSTSMSSRVAASTAVTPYSPIPVAPPADSDVSTPQQLVGEKLDGQPFYSIIVDGVHVHPYAVTVAASTHPAGLILVTDAMQAMGLPEGRHTLGGLSVDIYKGLQDGHYDGLHAVLSGTDTLAGAVVPLDTCVRNLQQYTRCEVPFALASVTSHPAALLGLEHVIGSLKEGCWADIVILDPKDLRVLHTFVAGELAFSASESATTMMAPA